MYQLFQIVKILSIFYDDERILGGANLVPVLAYDVIY
jgi:hypothetical protein